MNTQKEIASNLDVAAERACHIDRDPATLKQVTIIYSRDNNELLIEGFKSENIRVYIDGKLSK